MYRTCEKCNANLDIGESCTCHLEENEVFSKASDFVCKATSKGEIFIENITSGETMLLSKNKVYRLKQYSGIYRVEFLCRCLEKKLRSISDDKLELRVSIGNLAS